MDKDVLPIIYLDKGELENFSSLKLPMSIGHYYEWEGEQVVHLFIQPSIHSYGRTGTVLFSSRKLEDSENINPDARFFVEVIKKDHFISANVFEYDGQKWISRNVHYIPSKQELYSRNKGILEINILENKRVMIIGLGSFGSQIAIELAKAGVGSFALFDFDRVELHNLARHTCTIKELGRLKTDAIFDAIKGKNPYAIVDKFPININDDLGLLDKEIAKADIVICATDNNKSRFNISESLVKLGKVGIFGRAVTRAEGGDVFRYHPGGPCYCCLIGTGFYDSSAEEITNVNDPRIPEYADDPEAMVQVGLSADIEPICNLMIKLALVELSKGAQSGISSLENELIYDYYIWANRRERRHITWAPMPNAANRPTILRWYGARIPKDDNCPLCSKQIQLDVGEDIENIVGSNQDLSDIDLDKI